MSQVTKRICPFTQSGEELYLRNCSPRLSWLTLWAEPRWSINGYLGVYGSVPLWNGCAVQEEHQCIHSPYTNISSAELMCFIMNVAQYIYHGRFNVGYYINSEILECIFTYSLTAGVFGGHVEVNHVLSYNDVWNPVAIISNLIWTQIIE